MPLRLVRRSKTPYWVVRGTVRGIRIEESAGTDNKKIAEEIRAKREAEILAEAVYGRRATATFAQAALSYLQQGGSRRYLNEIFRISGPQRSPVSIRTPLIAAHASSTRTGPILLGLGNSMSRSRLY
jgi:hypothetical protein